MRQKMFYLEVCSSMICASSFKGAAKYFGAALFSFVLAMQATTYASADQVEEGADVGDEGVARIHILPFSDTDAIIIESVDDDGRPCFGMVDSGEDNDYPRDLIATRPGITQGQGREAEVKAYMKRIGVTPENFMFYIGTHPHSDHIGSAAQIIDEFHPQRVYAPEYSDVYISHQAYLWDNQYVYDNLISAVKRHQEDPDDGYNPELILHLSDGDAGDEAEKASLVSFGAGLSGTDHECAGTTGAAAFSLGSANIEILNRSEAYKTTMVPDANYFSYGVKVSCNGRTAFLAGDINNYTDGDAAGVGDETRLSSELKGEVDLLKMGHHGHVGSNTPEYLTSILRPVTDSVRSVAIQTGEYRYMPAETIEALDKSGVRHFTAKSCKDWGSGGAFVADLTPEGVSTNLDQKGVYIVQTRTSEPYARVYRDGLPYPETGWHWGTDGREYYFGDLASGKKSSTPVCNVWAIHNGLRAYVDQYGRLTTGWKEIDGAWYLFSQSGSMLTGWQQVKGEWFYLQADGKMAPGWQQVGGKWYYLDPVRGDMKTGLTTIGGKRYLLSGSGAMVEGNGWTLVENTWYYLEPSGALVTGWLKLGSTWYYLQPECGAMATGWADVNGTWYLMNGSGAMLTGWQWVGNAWYYLNSGGAMVTGWADVNGTWYYLEGSGAMHTGWLQSGRTWYYLDASGAMATGARTIGGVTYHFAESGAMR